MRVGVVILNYNTSGDCQKCISYLKTQQGVACEIVVVDNCSAAEDVAQLTEICRQEGVVLIKNAENRGYSAGNNIGLRYVVEQGLEFALIVNPDMELHQPDYLCRMVETMSAEERIVVLGTDIVNQDNVPHNPMHHTTYFEELFPPYEIISRRIRQRYAKSNPTKSGYCKQLAGCCFLIRLSFVREINYFDENVFLYCEESILAKQVERLGYEMYYMADIIALHRHIVSQKGSIAKRLKILAQSRDYYWEHYGNYPRFMLWMRKQIIVVNLFLLSRLGGRK